MALLKTIGAKLFQLRHEKKRGQSNYFFFHGMTLQNSRCTTIFNYKITVEILTSYELIRSLYRARFE